MDVYARLHLHLPLPAPGPHDEGAMRVKYIEHGAPSLINSNVNGQVHVGDG